MQANKPHIDVITICCMEMYMKDSMNVDLGLENSYLCQIYV